MSTCSQARSSSATMKEIFISDRFPEARWRVVRRAIHFLENLKAIAEFSFQFFRAMANETFSIGNIVPVLLAAAALAREDEIMLSSFPSSYRLL